MNLERGLAEKIFQSWIHRIDKFTAMKKLGSVKLREFLYFLVFGSNFSHPDALSFSMECSCFTRVAKSNAERAAEAGVRRGFYDQERRAGYETPVVHKNYSRVLIFGQGPASALCPFNHSSISCR